MAHATSRQKVARRTARTVTPDVAGVAEHAVQTLDTLLVGRHRELRYLSQFTVAKDGSDLPVVVIDGPPGIGKSRLLRHAAAVQASRGRLVLLASCSPDRASVPLGLVGDLIASRGSTLEGAVPPSPAGPRAAGSACEVPSPPLAVASHDALLGLVSSLAKPMPLCVYVDDVQSADAQSLTWLTDLRGFLKGRQARIVVSVADWLPQGESLRSLVTGAGAQRLTLQPLSAAEVVALVTAALGTQHPDVTADFFTWTLGNPRLVRDLAVEVSHRAPSGLRRDTPALAGIAADVLGAYLRTILLDHSRDALAIVHAVALLGPEATLEAATRLSGLDHATVMAEVRHLGLTGVIACHEGALHLPYPSAARLAESMLSDDDVSAARLRAARILGVRPETADKAAAQLLDVGPQGQPWITDQLLGAARRAMRRCDPESVTKLLRRALEEAPRTARARSIREFLGSAEAVVDPDRAVSSLRTLLSETTKTADRAQVVDRLAEAFVCAGRPAEAVATVEAEIAAIGATDADALHTLSARRYLLETEEQAAAQEGGRQPPDVTPPRRSERRCDSAAALVRGIGLTSSYRLTEAATCLDRVIEAARDECCALRWARAAVARADVAYRAGDLPTAVNLAQDCLELTKWVIAPVRLSATSILVRALLEQDGLEQAWDAIGLLVPSHDRDDWRWGELLHARGALRLAQGDITGCLDDLYACGQLTADQGRDDPAQHEWRLLAASALAALGERDEAVTMASEAYHQARGRRAPAALTSAALRVLGVITDDERRVCQAVTALEHTPARLELAKALADHATFQMREAPAQARKTLQRASELAAQCGAHGLMRRLDQLLVSAGGRPRRPVLGLRALTRSQLSVAIRAAAGRTNREIAEDLTLTQRTVELHLTNAYRKLNIGSRRQLLTIVAEDAASLDTGTMAPAEGNGSQPRQRRSACDQSS